MNAFVDANIFIRVATQGRPGCERKHFDDLRKLVENGTFTLLVPEVVHLEVEKVFRSLANALESNCDKLSNSIRKATEGTWNEIDSLKTDVLDRIRQLKQERIAACKTLSQDILAFLGLNAVTKIPLTPEIMVAAKRRRIAGKMPNCKNSSDQDTLIVESLISHLRSNRTSDLLLFCTENTGDFALEVGSSELDRTFVLYPDIQEALPKAHFSTTLSSMLSITSGFEHLPEPTSEEIEAALENRRLHDDIDDESFDESQQALMEAVNKKYVRQFNENILPLLPAEIQNERVQLADEITQILSRCRSCHSWGERSEYKLPQWIEFIERSMIPYTSLPKMVQIRNNLRKYLQIHLDMDSEQPPEDKGN
jgi:hypothetical protein